MKPEMVDATLLKRNPNALKRKMRRQTHELLLDGENAPLDLSRTSNSTSDDEDPTTRVYYIYNPPTQTYEPVTIISLGDEGTNVAEDIPTEVQRTTPHLAALQPQLNSIDTDHEEIVQTCDAPAIAGEVIVCDTFKVVREEVVNDIIGDVVKEEVVKDVMHHE